MLKRLVLMFRLDLSAHLKDVAEKQVPAKLQPMVIRRVPWILGIGTHDCSFQIVEDALSNSRGVPNWVWDIAKIQNNIPWWRDREVPQQVQTVPDTAAYG